MPTRHPRIQVTKDPELAAALDRVRRLPGADAREARLVRELAMRGAEQMAAEDRARREALDWLAERSTSPDFLDRELLARVREAAWPAADRR